MFSPRDQYWMEQAMDLAREAEAQGEVPVGAVLVLNDEVIGKGGNRPISHIDPTAHAETVALREGAKHLSNYRLLNTTLYVTLEPCLMCVGAMVHARVKRLVYGASDPKAGAVHSICEALTLPLNHQVEAEGGLMAEACGKILTEFFRARRS